NNIVPQLLEHGRIVRPGLGVNLANDALAARHNIEGVIVYQVIPGSAADRAGILGARPVGGGGAAIEDVIVGIDGTAIRSANDIYKALDRYKVGDTVDVTLENKSQGTKRTVKVTLQAIQ